MNIDLDQSLQSLVPWDLQYTINGQLYRTRRPSIGTVARLVNLRTTQCAELHEAVKELFVSPPPLEGQPAEMLWAIATSYMAYFSSESSKNFPPIAANITAAMGNRSPR